MKKKKSIKPADFSYDDLRKTAHILSKHSELNKARIAEILKVDHKTVRRWLKTHIPRSSTRGMER
jgi:transcription initiation factor IIE alpha subunit